MRTLDFLIYELLKNRSRERYSYEAFLDLSGEWIMKIIDSLIILFICRQNKNQRDFIL